MRKKILLKKYKDLLQQHNSANTTIPAEQMQAYFGNGTLGFGGAKFNGGLGVHNNADDFIIDPSVLDLYSIRRESAKQYNRNTVAHSIIDTFENAVVGCGLRLEATPRTDIIESNTGAMIDKNTWTNKTEQSFDLWARSQGASYDYSNDFYTMQALAYRSYLLHGKMLAVIRYTNDARFVHNKRLSRCNIQLIEYSQIAQILNTQQYQNMSRETIHDIIDGQAINQSGRVLGYFINTKPNTTIINGIDDVRYIKKFGTNGRQWVVDITRNQNANDIQGYPMLTHILHDLSGLERYSLAEIQAALVNATIAMQSTNDRQASTDPIAQGGKRARQSIQDVSNDTHRRVDVNVPGLLVTHAIPGEQLSAFATQRPNVNYTAFAEAVLSRICASIGMPLEVMLKKFNSNYSASRAALVEWWRLVQEEQVRFGRMFCEPIYQQWLDAEIQDGRIQCVGWYDDDLIRRNTNQAAWSYAMWYGQSRIGIDPMKEVRAHEIEVERGWSTNEQIARTYYNSDYFDNIQRLAVEREARGLQNNPNETTMDIQNE